jgi:hypothetical protein
MAMKYELYCLSDYELPNWMSKEFRFVLDFTKATHMDAWKADRSISPYFVFAKNIHHTGRLYYFINNEDRLMFLLSRDWE